MPQKLVSHPWGANFKDLVWTIARDATGVTGEEELNRLICSEDISEKALRRTYWLVSVCGTCECGSRIYAADPCVLCGREKRYPCPCGTPKHPKTDPRYEMDKLDMVINHMKAGSWWRWIGIW